MGCQGCGAAEARVGLDSVELCDACYNDRVSEQTGLAPLPLPPPTILLRGPDGRTHELRFRVLRAPVGVEVKLEEAGVPVGDGYDFAVLGDHDADVGRLAAQVEAIARREVGRQYLEPAEHRAGWRVTDGDGAAGRFVWNERSDGAPDVVVDGRRLSWEEFGEALGSYEGWNFRLVVEDRVVEAEAGGAVEVGPDAVVVPIGRARGLDRTER